MHRLYEAETYDTAHKPQSYWRASCATPPALPALAGETQADVAVIGAGYAGLNAALELVERHGLNVAVLDAGQPGWGASGRNGGFVCMGSAALDDAQITRSHGTDAAQEFSAFQEAAIDRVADNLARYDIDADRGPAGEICLAHSPRAFRTMRDGATTQGMRLVAREELAGLGFGGMGFHGGMMRAQGFSLHPLKYVLGLSQAAQAQGVRIYGDTPVLRMRAETGGWVLDTAAGQIRARRVLVATNGYSDETLPPWLSGRILPVLSSILVTRQLTSQERAAQGWQSHVMAYDSRRVLHYFRLLPCGRFLFGGRGGVSGSPEALAKVDAVLRHEFETMFPAFAGAETEHAWSGLVCLTGSLTPFCAQVPGQDGLFAALGWHGNGVAAASEAGRRIAGALAGGRNSAPALLQAPLRRMPLADMRRPVLRIGMALARMLDGPIR